MDPLLAGRPSDLSREAGRVPPPPPPPEAEFVASRDFRLVHFSGYTLVVLDVPRELDLHLAARVARERYDAQLSLAGVEGEELLVLAGDEGPGHRGFDLPGMVDHLSVKYAWIEALPAEDRVARLRVQRLREEDGRLDEVVTEIAMGRSIVEACTHALNPGPLSLQGAGGGEGHVVMVVVPLMVPRFFGKHSFRYF